MPQFNRRGFLQLAGAASLAPVLPTLPARAAAASATISPAKALWAGIYAKAGSTGQFVEAARGLGLSQSAISGVSARTLGVRVAVRAVAQTMPPAHTTSLPAPMRAKPAALKRPCDVLRRIERVLTVEDQAENEAEIEAPEMPEDPGLTRKTDVSETPEQG